MLQAKSIRGHIDGRLKPQGSLGHRVPTIMSEQIATGAAAWLTQMTKLDELKQD
jgi:hypothetical protein